MIKEVMLIFKTHLDLGFTDFAANIIEKYLNSYIPKAIELGYKLRGTETPFIWTTGSWLVYEALRRDGGMVEQAVKDGIISWHGLPFTTHTELMNETLFRAGLSLSQELDKRFGIRTTGAKMTDVPGHTFGMVPLMANAGIKLLHIGVNPATPKPQVPDLFRWQCGDKSIAVLYNGGGYGDFFEIGELAVGFGHTGDNCGPQSAEQIMAFYQEVQKKYPHARIYAANLNMVAEKMEGVQMPVVDREIGDSWIYGAASDPWKLSAFREVSRKIEQTEVSGQILAENLLMVPEHTWGMDVKTFYPDTDVWEIEEFQKTEGEEKRRRIEASWQEQREYVEKAARLLGCGLPEKVQTPPCITEDMAACDAEVPVEVSWQLFDVRDYERYRQQYIQIDSEWAIWDLTKMGLPEYEGKTLSAERKEGWQTAEGKKVWKLEFPDAERYGLPAIYVEALEGLVTVKWIGKKSSRYPQAFWVKFKGTGENWEINKMGQWILPEEVVDGSLLCGVERGVRNERMEIETLDAALAAPFGRHLLEYGIERGEQDLYFNLYNNVWNTNFTMWYSDDAEFKFQLRKRQMSNV